MYTTVFALFSLILFSEVALANTTIPVDAQSRKYSINEYGEYFVDIKHAENPQALLADNPEFTPLDPDNRALRLSSLSDSVWVRFELQNLQKIDTEVVLEMTYVAIDIYDIFIPESGIYRKVELGDTRPYKNREYETGTYAVDIDLKPGEGKIVYVRARSRGLMLLPLFIHTGNNFIDATAQRAGSYRLYTGIAVGLFFFSLMLGIQTRDKVYLVYSLLVLMRAVWLFNSEGVLLKILQDHPAALSYITIYITGIYVASSVLFHSVFLRYSEYQPKTNIALHCLAAAFVFIGLILPWFNYGLASLLLQPMIILTNLFYLVSAGWRAFKGFKPALIYFVALWPTMVVTIYMNLSLRGYLTYTEDIALLLGLAFSISLILFSIALSTRINALNKEKVEAESLALKSRVEAETKSDFLAQMSHEIRTPMNGVLGISELMAKTNLDETQKKYNNIIHSSGKLLLQVIDDVLDFSKIQAGKMQIELIPFNPGALFDEVENLFSAKMAEKGIKLRLRIGKDVPNILCGDSIRIRQILFNLVNNASKFTEKGSIRIKLEKDEKPNCYRFSVSDTGVGISETNQQNLFLPYYQAGKSTTRKYGGTGLGLSICKQLSELMGGEIGFASEEGKGSTFWFQLPLNEVDDVGIDELEVKQKTLTVSGDSNGQSAMHILVAEDNPVNQIVVQGMLSTLGHTTQIVSNGQDAVDVIKSNAAKFNLILMDCDMPVLDGISATKEIRAMEQGEKIPIIAVTAHALEKEIESCKQAGMNIHLTKPLKLDELRNSLNQF